MKFLSVAWAVFCTFFASATEFPPPTDFGPIDQYGRSISRTMNLLASSTPEHRNKVRILFYGQSITEQYWSTTLSADLRQRFPNADLEISNRAIPGFTSEVLWKTAEADLYPFYPDLLIFHVYGSTDRYERIIAQARARTTADIIVQTDHPTLIPELMEPVTPATGTDFSSQAWRNYVFLPDLAARYGCELADVRTYWKRYLLANNYLPQVLLADTIHLNNQGNYLMGELIKSHFRETQTDVTLSGVRTYTVGSELKWVPVPETSLYTLSLEFEGNRVDLLPSISPTSPVTIFVDGKKPSQFPESYSFTRVNNYRNTAWPCLLRATSISPLTNETWTITVIETNTVPWLIRFNLRGSQTGFDGVGSSSERFVSASRRVVIDPEDWMLSLGGSVSGSLPLGFEIKFESKFLGADTLEKKTYDPARENAQTVVQGISNGRHTLTLTTTDPAALTAVRVYNPLARTQPLTPASARVGTITAGIDSNKLVVNVSAAARYVLEASRDIDGPWETISAPTEEKRFSFPVTADSSFLRLRFME